MLIPSGQNLSRRCTKTGFLLPLSEPHVTDSTVTYSCLGLQTHEGVTEFEKMLFRFFALSYVDDKELHQHDLLRQNPTNLSPMSLPLHILLDHVIIPS
jgi:hypothetical protein